MKGLLGAVGLAIREAATSGSLPRRPETQAMSDPDQIASFDAAAEALAPVYHFNAIACGRLLPVGGTMLDLGSGSGRFLAHLARYRPDVRILGLELSREMVRFGRKALAAEGLGHRVKLRVGDMTDLRACDAFRPDLVSSVFALHHLPDESALERTAAELRRYRKRFDSTVWIFDHARPRSTRTAASFPNVFTPNTPAAFRRDSMNSLLAAWSFERLARVLAVDDFDDGWQGMLARRLKLYQVHWVGQCRRFQDDRVAMLPPRARKRFRALRGLFPGVAPVSPES